MGAIIIIWMLLKIIGPIYCAKEAERKNRSSALWGIFGFLFPLIAMPCIALVPPVTRWEEEN
jgi:hypothetical protein